MNLTASLVVRNEVSRYLEPCVEHLLGFCDTVVVLDDASDDGTREWLVEHHDERLHVVLRSHPGLFVNESIVRQELLTATLAQSPSHVLAIDADEFVADGAALRAAVEDDTCPGWTMSIEEIWNARPDGIDVREDGGWRSHEVPFLWAVPRQARLESGLWRISRRELACGRVPRAVYQLRGSAHRSGVELLHFGWTDLDTRYARWKRYADRDRGRFHARSHIDSILWADDACKLRGRDWPEGAVFDAVRAKLCGDPVAL